MSHPAEKGCAEFRRCGVGGGFGCRSSDSSGVRCFRFGALQQRSLLLLLRIQTRLKWVETGTTECPNARQPIRLTAVGPDSEFRPNSGGGRGPDAHAVQTVRSISTDLCSFMDSSPASAIASATKPSSTVGNEPVGFLSSLMKAVNWAS